MNAPAESVAGLLVEAAGLYLALGLVVAAGVHWRGLRRIDPATRGAGLGFRILITPGLVALWPWLLVVWNRAARGSGFAGGRADSPPPDSLRDVQAWTWKLLAFLIPAALCLLLLARPADEPPSRLPEPPSNPSANRIP